MLQVIYLKYIVWGDWTPSTIGIALAVIAVLARLSLAAKSNEQHDIPTLTPNTLGAYFLMTVTDANFRKGRKRTS